MESSTGWFNTSCSWPLWWRAARSKTRASFIPTVGRSRHWSTVKAPGQRRWTCAVSHRSNGEMAKARLSHPPKASDNRWRSAMPPQRLRASKMCPATQGPMPFTATSVRLSAELISTLSNSDPSALTSPDTSGPVWRCALRCPRSGWSLFGLSVGKRRALPKWPNHPSGRTFIRSKSMRSFMPPRARA